MDIHEYQAKQILATSEFQFQEEASFIVQRPQKIKQERSVV